MAGESRGSADDGGEGIGGGWAENRGERRGETAAVTGSRGGLASRTEMAADGCSDGRATAPQIWTGSGAVLLRGGLRTEEENGKKGSAASCGREEEDRGVVAAGLR
ncbi:hypothetical protein CSA_007708, partial [Cucumis sativus]